MSELEKRKDECSPILEGGFHNLVRESIKPKKKPNSILTAGNEILSESMSERISVQGKRPIILSRAQICDTLSLLVVN